MNASDIEAEKHLATALVTNPDAWDRCGDSLRAPMFVGDTARDIFTAVRSVVLTGRLVTPTAVQDALVAAGKGASVIGQWSKSRAAPLSDVPTLAARIRDLWGRRELVRAAEDALTHALDQPAKETADALSSAIAAVSTASTTQATKIDRVVFDWMGELEADAKAGTASVFIPTGFPVFDRETGGLARGELSVFAARPGNGKSSLMVAMAANIAATGVPVGCIWLEDDRRDFARRLVARRMHLNAHRFRGTADSALRYLVADHKSMSLNDAIDLPIYVDDTHGLTITDITARMRRMSREHGVRVFILDHLGEVLIEKDDRWGDRHDLALGRVARTYRDTAKSLGAVPILVSQMNRRFEQRTEEIPRMSDLDGSGQVEQAARLIAFLQQQKNQDGTATGEGMLHVVKVTGGSPCSVKLKWDGPSMTWHP